MRDSCSSSYSRLFHKDWSCSADITSTQIAAFLFCFTFCVSFLELDWHHMGSWFSRVSRKPLHWSYRILSTAHIRESDEVHADGQSLFTSLLIIFSLATQASAVCSYFLWNCTFRRSMCVISCRVGRLHESKCWRTIHLRCINMHHPL